jgi:eukaryotic-like serine/threonine-protein kinase
MTHQAEDLSVIEGGGGPGSDLIGKTIDGRYKVERVLGEGGMGLVYQAKHTVLNKPLAIKVLRPDVSRDEEIITRFRQEAQSATAIGNQHIIDISDFGTLPDGSTYFVMEFLEGTDLTGAIEKGEPITAPRMIHIGLQLCDALSAAHSAGIVHRDLKPDNIYLVSRGKDKDFVKVLDFGIAKVGGNSSKLTRAGQVFGTPHYMSPEQCSGTGVDHRTDIYAIGIIFYEMLARKVPFDADNLMGILTKHLYEEPVPLSQIVPDIPEALERVIARAMAKNVEERYANMDDLADDLRRAQQGIAPAAVSFARTLAPGAFRGGAAPGKKASPLVPILLGALALVAGGVGAVVALSGDDEEIVVEAPVAAVAEPEPVAAAVKDPEPEPAPAPARTIAISSDPDGAEIWKGDALVGNTPIDLPVPSEGGTIEYELRYPGYVSKTFPISSATIAKRLSFRLGPEPAARKGSGGAKSTRPATTASAPAPAESKPARRAPVGVEVLDPWAH